MKPPAFLDRKKGDAFVEDAGPKRGAPWGTSNEGTGGRMVGTTRSARGMELRKKALGALGTPGMLEALPGKGKGGSGPTPRPNGA